MATLGRMRSYTGPRMGTWVWMLVAAAAGTAAGLAVPLVVRHVVDGPARHRQVGGLVLLGALALPLGVIEAGAGVLRGGAPPRGPVAHGDAKRAPPCPRPATP